jgi:hypothetical protein
MVSDVQFGNFSLTNKTGLSKGFHIEKKQLSKMSTLTNVCRKLCSASAALLAVEFDFEFDVLALFSTPENRTAFA